MGVSSHVYGFVPPDEKWQAMKKVWDACEAAGIVPPKEVAAFFGWETPDSQGVKLEIQQAVKEYRGDAENGFEVEIAKLPPNVKVIRFVNSY